MANKTKLIKVRDVVAKCVAGKRYQQTRGDFFLQNRAIAMAK